MEVIDFLLSSSIGLAVLLLSLVTFKSIRNVKYRLYIERKLAHNLAVSLKKRKIDSKVSVRLNKITVQGKCSEKQLISFRKEIDSALQEAIKELVSSERDLVMRSLEQPSRKGQFNYLKKLVSNSLDELHHDAV